MSPPGQPSERKNKDLGVRLCLVESVYTLIVDPSSLLHCGSIGS